MIISPKNLSISVREITAVETFPVRHAELRQGRPLAECSFEGDDLSTTFHLGLFADRSLVGIATFLEKENPLFTGKQLQLRGMAVLSEYQGQKLGDHLLEAGESMAIQRNKDIIWCNARIIAVNFYLRNGYQIKGDPFEIKDVGTHFVMFKNIAHP